MLSTQKIKVSKAGSLLLEKPVLDKNRGNKCIGKIMFLRKKKYITVNDNVSDDPQAEDLGNKTQKMLRSRFLRRNLIKTGLVGTGLYTFEKTILNPVRGIAAESSPAENDQKLPMGLLPTIPPTKNGFALLNSATIATEIEKTRNSKSNNKEGWLEVWQALAKLVEVNKSFVDEYRQQQNNPDYPFAGIPIGEMTDFFNRAGQGQNPIGVILGCVDSRVHYERRLSLKDSDDIPGFFVERSIGNVVNPYNDLSLGATVQYNLEGIGRDVVVLIQMVHQNCGMVSAAASGKAMKLGGALETAGYLVKPAVEPGSPWKGFIDSWPNQTDSDINVMANGLMQLAHLFASSEYLKEQLKQKKIFPILGYIPLDTPEVYLFKLPPALVTMYETMTVPG
ncbi:MAG: carbonic anhydrase [Xenococcaceae cyanobacterium MO_188.B32]|nr:carbonic anhydrase [Xenococcaceae cyanobacterium MO_188.B32]